MSKYFFIILILSASACGLFESLEEEPMLVKIDSVSLNAKDGQGTSIHGIKDIWPSADGQSVGVFEMPTSFPVISELESTTFSYFAGIFRNAISSDRLIYPFYERITKTISNQPGQTITEDLVFEYKDDAVFDLTESFDSANVFIKDVDGDDTTKVVITDIGCLEGFCGLIKLTPNNNVIEVATDITFSQLPKNGTPIFLEIDYKNDIDLQIGLQASLINQDVDQYIVGLFPTDTWKKAYIDLSSLVQQSQLDNFRVLMRATNFEQENKEIRIDNIKLIHF